MTRCTVPSMSSYLTFGLWSVRFPPVLVRTGRRLPVQALGERRVLVAVTGYPRGGAPGPGRSFVTRVTRNQREIWYMESGPSRVNAPLEGPVIPRSRRNLSKTKASGKEGGGEALSPGLPEIKEKSGI
jgi:hypothetical protein